MDKNYNSNFFTPSIQYSMEKISLMLKDISSAIQSITFPQVETNTLNQLFENIDYISSILKSSVFEDTINAIDFNSLNNAYIQTISQLKTSLSYDFSSLTNGISLNENYVEIDPNTINTITDFLEEHDQTPPQNIKSKMSIKDFILCILIPFICMLVPILQNSYYHRLDTVEAQKNQLLESEYNAALLEIESQHTAELEELNNNINNLLQYLESAQDSQLPPASTPNLSSDTQENLSESDDIEAETDGDSCNHNMY